MKLSDYVNETNLSRVFQHLNEPNRCMIAISADRNEISGKAKKERQKNLEKDIRMVGFGFSKVTGGYEEKIDNSTIEVIEKSFLVFFKLQELEKAKKYFNHLRDKYDQDAYLLVVDGKAAFIDKNDNIQQLGKWYPKQLDIFFTKLKNGRKFSFSNTIISEGNTLCSSVSEKLVSERIKLAVYAAAKNNTTFAEEQEKCKEIEYAKSIEYYFNKVKNEIE